MQNLDGINQPFTCEQWADFGGIESYNIVNDGPLYTLYDLFSTDGSWHSIAVFDQHMVLRYYGFQEPADLIDNVIEDILSETNYIFSENIRITESSNDQKFPEIAVDNNIIHLTWVSVIGNNKNIMYSKSENYGDSFSNPLQINYVNNNIVAYGQSGPKIGIFDNKVYISYTDDRNGLTSVYLNVSDNYGETWQEEILVSDTPYLNAYQDFEVDNQGNVHLVYYNYAANYHLDDVRYRFSELGDTEFNPSIELGIVMNNMEPCDCCQPDLEIDDNGDVYVIYRNNEQNIRDSYIAVKRYGDNNFSEYFQASDLQDFIGFCPSSGPSMALPLPPHRRWARCRDWRGRRSRDCACRSPWAAGLRSRILQPPHPRGLRRCACSAALSRWRWERWRGRAGHRPTG